MKTTVPIYARLGFFSLLVIGLSSAKLTYKPFHISAMPEICDNAVDDDMDGFIDLNDPDCVCEELLFESLIPNHSFEEKSCCPFEHRQLECATGWTQAGHTSIDFIHTCDWLGWNGMLDVEDYPVPLPLPDGEGAAGFRDGRVPIASGEIFPKWKSYAGACLLRPLKAGEMYRIEFDIGFVNEMVSPDINITLFGTNSCDYFPFDLNSPDLLGCPSNYDHWDKLGQSALSGGGQNVWVKSFIDITPTQDISGIAIGPPCPLTEAENNTYYYLDNLLLEDVEAFDFRISEVSHPCESDFSLAVKSFPSIDYQWFVDGVALIGETNPILSMIHGEGDYQVRMLDAGSCKLSEAYRLRRPLISLIIEESMCVGDVYEFGGQFLSTPGTYVDFINSASNCDSMLTLHLEVFDVYLDTVNVEISNGEAYNIGQQTLKEEGDFLINLEAKTSCDSMVLVRLTYQEVYIPNVFSPNQDGYNDTFIVMAEQGQIANVDLKVYNRWGEMIFRGSEWDGKHQGEYVSEGIFLYFATVEMQDGSLQPYSGVITVLK